MNTSTSEQASTSVRLLKKIHGEKAKVFTSAHHARYFEDDKIYHVVSRVIGGLSYLVPSEEVNRVIAGVLGHVQEYYSEIELFAHAFMSNHFHLALRGSCIPRFMGLLKQELSRRLKQVVDVEFETLWSGRYAATALILDEDQLRAFEYILSHGVKEGLVERPEEWPGVHCAPSVFFGTPCVGEWLNATTYGRAKLLEARKAPEKQREVLKADHTTQVEVRLTRLPALARLDEEGYREAVAKIRASIIEEGRASRKGKPAAGVKKILSMARTTRYEMPRPPWFENRKRLVVWSDLKAPETRAYLARYDRAQVEFKESSRRLRNGEMDVVFPPGMYRPGIAPRRQPRQVA